MTDINDWSLAIINFLLSSSHVLRGNVCLSTLRLLDAERLERAFHAEHSTQSVERGGMNAYTLNYVKT